MRKYKKIMELYRNLKDNSNNFFLMAGPCVIENEQMPFEICEKLKEICERLDIDLIFKASYRKANRSKIDSFSGIGDEKALKILGEIRKKYSLPVVTDIHSAEEAEMAAKYVDILQIPAFLCRQTDLLLAAAKTNKIINIKSVIIVMSEQSITYTLNLNNTMSPSCMIYSLPSLRTRPFSFAVTIEPPQFMKSVKAITSALIKPRSKSV